jgi:drug/metabolite transporter (DMT)-like permease
MANEFAAVVFGLASAASYGIADFTAGYSSRKTPVLMVVLLSQSVGLLLALALAILYGEQLVGVTDLFWGAAAGLVGMIGVAALYQSMAIGQMSINAPITAVLAAAIPVIVGITTQGLPEWLQVVGFSLALAGIWLISRSHGEHNPQQSSDYSNGITLALVAGTGFGVMFVLFGQFQDNAVFFPLVAARITSIFVMFTFALFSQRLMFPSRGAIPLIVFAGLLDMGGNLFFVFAEQAGRLDIASVLSSLYPVATVILALVLLRERLIRPQRIGIALVFTAIICIVI